jgi:phytoene/squalene synthetase
MMQLFTKVSSLCSEITTKSYSTSFSSAIKLLHKDLQRHVYNIYGFVRFADEIVDTFHDYDKTALLHEFRQSTFEAIERKISLNPILNSFQSTVNYYNIDLRLIDAFLKSMKSDLNKKLYDTKEYDAYIYGSAETVGMMCLYVFSEGDMVLYERLKTYAKSLGAAFQKVNFLRDLKNDFEALNRTYFPHCDINNFSFIDKQKIEEDIEKDFDHAYSGIMQLPVKSRFGVYVAYKYYLTLFKKIQRLQPRHVKTRRVRIPNYGKVFIIAMAGVRSQLNIL